MESSSEDDFAWTNSSDSESEKEINMVCDEESESGKSFKKKLQKELFQNGHDDAEPAETPRKRKKVKRECVTPAQERSVERSPGHDHDHDHRGHVSHDHDHRGHVGHDRGHHSGRDEGDDAHAELLLRQRVKEERAARPDHDHDRDHAGKRKRTEDKSDREHDADDAVDGAPRHKKKKHKHSEKDEAMDDSIVDKSQAEEAVVAEPAPPTDDSTTDRMPRKKKKKRKHKESEREVSGDDLVIDKFEAGETVVETRRSEPQVNGHASPEPARGRDTHGPYTSREFVDDEPSSEGERPPERARVAAEQPPERRLRISERIAFDSDSDSRPAPTPAPAERTDGRLARYLRAHAELRPAAGELAREASVGADDDVWVVRAPRDLPAAALLGAALPLERRGKLALGGRRYEALPAPGGGRVALLARGGAGAGALVLRGVRVRGTLQLRVRVPRPRAPPDRGEREPDRIPLPATRPRHPLLGAGYERAQRLPPDVRRRLGEARAPAAAAAAAATDAPDGSPPREKKKKKRKERPELVPAESEPKWRERKRKRSSLKALEPEQERGGGKRARTGDDAALWDSERAIEESLFDY